MKGKIRQNLDSIAEIIRQCSSEVIDLVLFPESSTTGYFLEGGTLELAMTCSDLQGELNRRIGPLKHPVDVVIGYFEVHEGNLYNSASCFSFGSEPSTLGTYRKFFLPSYGVFDEERFVGRGSELGVIETRFGKVGILICEDVWHSVLPMLCAVSGARILLVPSASPGRGFSGDMIGNLERYDRMLRAVCEEHGVFALNCQLCGFEGGKGFVGGSSIVSPMGEVLARSPVSDPHLLVSEVDLDMIEIARSHTPLISDLQSAWSDIQGLVAQIRA